MLNMRDRRAAWTLAALGLGLVVGTSELAWGQAPRAGSPRQAAGHDHDHDHGHADGVYKGRRIAEVMGFGGADWLLRETRVEEEQPDRMLDALEITPGMTVADVGAGVGYHSLKLAERVGPEGLVYASDLQPQMLWMLIDRAEQARVTNIVPVLATPTYTGLPDGQIDLILMVDVYHEISTPEHALAAFRQALRPGGRLVLVEYRGEDPNVPIRPLHKMTAAQVRREVEPLGFRFVANPDFLPWQHILIFEKPADGQGEPVGAAEREVAP